MNAMDLGYEENYDTAYGYIQDRNISALNQRSIQRQNHRTIQQPTQHMETITVIQNPYYDEQRASFDNREEFNLGERYAERPEGKVSLLWKIPS